MPKDVRNNRNFHFLFYIPLAIFLLCFIVVPLLPYIMGESLLDLFGPSIVYGKIEMQKKGSKSA